mgnify:CR=1 FL=1
MDFPAVLTAELGDRLGFREPFLSSTSSTEKNLSKWRMEEDDAPIFRYVYRNFRPKRHLEFGTWQGLGATFCLEECDAAVWTINLPFGENNQDGSNAYGYYGREQEALLAWAEKIGLPIKPSRDRPVLNSFARILQNKKKGPPVLRTDSIGFIGRFYLEKGLGHRVCQIYSDSRKWDTSNYPPGFFDSALVDGGHTYELVDNDTRKALQLVRSGGLVLWHDFCPDPQALASCS